MAYRDFEIEIAARDGRHFEVEVTFEGMDETIQRRFEVELPPSYLDLLPPEGEAGQQELRNWRRAPTAGEPDELPFLIARMDKLKHYGARLFKTVLTTQLEQALGQLFEMGREQGGVRIRLDLERAPALAKVPWEAMFREATDQWYGIDEKSPMLRRISLGGRQKLPVPITGEVRLLIAIAVPQKDLDAGREIVSIEEEIRKRTSGRGAPISIRPLHAATRQSFEAALADFKPHIVHFIGHGGFGTRDGDRRGVVHFVDENNPEGYDAVPSDDLRQLLDSDPPLLVVLNTCEGGRADEIDRYGGTAQNIIRRSIPYVVAMQYPISDEAALAFSRYFYQRLLEGAPVDVAVARGRAAIRNRPKEECQVELITPVFYSSVDAPGPLVDASAETIAVPPPAPPVPPAPPLPPVAVQWPKRKMLAIAMLVALMTAAAVIATVLLFGRSDQVTEIRGTEMSGPVRSGIRPSPGPTDDPKPRPADRATSSGDQASPQSTPYGTSGGTSGTGRGPASVGDGPIYSPNSTIRPVEGQQVNDGPFPTNPQPSPPEPHPTPEPMPIPPPWPEPPPMPAPPPISASSAPWWSGSAIVFFDFDSHAISPDAAALLDEIASQILGSGVKRLRVAGFADRMGTAAVNLRMSKARAEAVAAFLHKRGVPADAIRIEAYGETRLRVETPDGVREIQNRRVEITADDQE